MSIYQKSRYSIAPCAVLLIASTMLGVKQQPITTNEADQLLFEFTEALAKIATTKPAGSSEATKKRSPGNLVLDVIETSSELLTNPKDITLKNRLKKEIMDLKADPVALNNLRAYPKGLIAEIPPSPSALEKAQFAELRKMLVLIHDIDKTIFLETDLRLLTQATQEDPGILQSSWTFARRNADIIFGALKIASKFYFGV